MLSSLLPAMWKPLVDNSCHHNSRLTPPAKQTKSTITTKQPTDQIKQNKEALSIGMNLKSLPLPPSATIQGKQQFFQTRTPKSNKPGEGWNASQWSAPLAKISLEKLGRSHKIAAAKTIDEWHNYIKKKTRRFDLTQSLCPQI